MKKIIALFVFMLALINTHQAQQPFALDPVLYHVFDSDSLKGFDEEAAKRSAISEDFTGPEFPVRMYQLKRSYINDKYQLWAKIKHVHQVAESHVEPGCVNEDFEAETASATITAINQINGWSITRGLNSGQNNNSCNLNGCCPSTPSESAVFVAPNGWIDPAIGACYPIYSVFGSTPGVPNGNVVNPQIPFTMKGNNFIRINSSNNNQSIEKLSKTFSVTPNNAIFQFAFISVFSTGHGCCDAGAFKIQLPGIPCPTYSASALSSQCTNSTTINYLKVGTCAVATATSGGNIFNKWNVASMDLTAYLGQTITIEIVATDCTAGGHYGYVYFDSQCGPMTIIGNGVSFPAGTQSVVVPTCGAAGATMCAVSGLGPYAWIGPNVPANYSIPSMTNQCYTSSISATYTLQMNPAGSCSVIERRVTSTITPAPLLGISAVQATCGNTLLAIVTVTPGGSAGTPLFINWSPTPFSLNNQSVSAQYVIPTGPAPSVVSVTASDPIGCLVTSTIDLMPAPPYPIFSILNNTGAYLITCRTPSVDLTASMNYTYGTLNYFWSSSSYTSTGANVILTTGGVYTVIASDPVTMCSNTKTFAIVVNTVAPVSIVTPTFQNVTCSVSSVADVSITAVSPSVNISHVISDPLGGSFTSQSYSLVYQASGTGSGTFTHCIVNDVTGCSTCKQFTVGSTTGFPTFSLTSTPPGYTLGCNTKSTAVINIANGQTTPPAGALSYTLLAPNTASSTPGILTAITTYSIVNAGTYTVIAKDNVTFCETRIPVTVLSNTFGPSIDTVMIPTRVLDCNTTQVLLQGMSRTPDVTYEWGFPGIPGVLVNDSILVPNKPDVPTNTLVANYTLTITDNNNTCISRTVVPIYQNLFPPKPLITNGGTNALTCKTFTIMLNNSSTTTIPSGISAFPPAVLPVIGFLWEGPTPQIPKSNSSTYVAQTVGEYTMIAKDLNNGCTSTTVASIADNKIYPTVNNPDVPPPSILDCGAEFTKLTPIVTSATTGLTYEWSGPITASLSGVNTPTLTTNSVGEYNVLVTNTVNGCATPAVMTVIDGTLSVEFAIDNTAGYAPLAVTFSNQARSTLNNEKVVSVWTFGNGTFSTTPSASISPSVVYNQPGTYTITLFASKGNCLESISKTIQVEIPSQLVVPNIFTPNGDGVNDLFFLRTSNLSEITIMIYDRWGHKVYDLVSDKGNVSWDGKNQIGKEVAEGTYFYVLKAKGNDGQEYDRKGTITLAR